jgi:glycosyltransferase involved in cell wall biosynthesis
MKVLVLPNNFGSMPSITIDALRKKGIDARGLTFVENKYNYRSEFMQYLPMVFHERKIKQLPASIISLVKHYFLLKKLLKWCDVIHWTSGFYLPLSLDYKLLKKSGKPGIVEFVGSETRNPEVLSPINKFYKNVYEAGDWEYKNMETIANSIRLQQMFKDVGFIPAVCPEMSLFLNNDIWHQHYYSLFQRFNVSSYTPNYPVIENKKIVISHSPSAKHTKGTYYIENAIANLQKKYPIEYKTYHNVPREKVLTAINESDIFIDQLIAGSYGTACMEAMSMGKPVVVYLMDQLFARGLPQEIPLVNANPDTIEQKLEELILDGQLRYDTGIKSRQFVEKYHNADTIATQLIDTFQELIDKKKME